MTRHCGLRAWREAGAVLVLRAHYTADVFAAIVTAVWAAGAAEGFGPVVDRALAVLLRTS